MSFTNPGALWLFLLLPIFAAIGWPRFAYRRTRDTISLIIRLLLVALLIVGLAGIQVQQTADNLAVVFLVDVSDSVSAQLRSAALDYVRAASATMSERDQAAVVLFGANALVEIPMTDRLELVQAGADPVRLNTDLAEAMRLGLALFPADAAKRMVILSDGKQTVGDAAEVARLAAATGVQIDVVPLIATDAVEGTTEPEILVQNVSVPATVNEGEQFDLTTTIFSNRADAAAEIRVLSSGEVIVRQDVTLQVGENTYVFPDLSVPTPGFVDFRVVVEPRGADTFYQNNELSAFTEVTGPPRVLVVASDVREVESLQAALEETGLQVDVQGPRDLPIGLAPLSAYDSIVLANVSATELGADRMRYLQAYVRDLGGGLVAVGGPDSFGVGGYFETPIEETLPVDMRLKDQQRIPQLTMLFVIDRSGSMEVASSSGVSNLELAKEAVVRSFDLLNNNDRTGVLSFDVSAYWVLHLQDLGDGANRDQMRAEVGALRPGGGTNIRQALLAADEVLRTDPSTLKHIILLTDGGADQSGIEATVDRMYQNYGITTSVVAVGRDYVEWLQQVATAGHGQFHLASDVSTIPAIFTSETLLATRSYIFEDDFRPALTATHPILRGIDSVPLLHGYVATSPKETATMILTGPEDDPILAAWQYGLGRSVAFTSDASSRWGSDWIAWDGYSDFWSQAIRWTITEGAASNIETRVEQRGEQAVIVTDVRDSNGNYLNGMQLDAAIVGSNLETATVPLQQTAPGRYEATFTPAQEGSYFITVAGAPSEDEGSGIMQTTGWVMSYSSEYRVGSEDDTNQSLGLLNTIARTTDGASLAGDPEDAFAHDLHHERAAQPLWPAFILAALLLFPADVAARRLVIGSREVERVRGAVGGVFTRRTSETQALTEERFGRLMDAKGRARSVQPGPDLPPAQESAPVESRRPAVPDAAPKPKPTPPPEGGSLAARLMERRRPSSDKKDE
ncbi:MAG TPA: VWA domain-containing protein [Aggregatilinea sp.]|uniref:VWA domain-containing protein n=1 Tax=Aggregatilinea sp. TaxID=2806333 RepID=UPI002C7C8AF9|nr:VWA domain-containing protein [Aggregatilinea sp.]HML20849.1 VWA domain-containing protein [Aggregatilinea sp.]